MLANLQKKPSASGTMPRQQALMVVRAMPVEAAASTPLPKTATSL